MKRLAVLTIMVLTMGVPGIVKANYLNHYFNGMYNSGYGCGYGWYSGYSGYGGYGGYGYGCDRTLGRVVGYGSLALNALQTVNQLSTNNRVLSIAEKEQDFRQEQIRAQNNTVPQNNTVLVRIERPEETQKNEELQQKIRILELELEKLKLQQKLNK